MLKADAGGHAHGDAAAGRARRATADRAQRPRAGTPTKAAAVATPSSRRPTPRRRTAITRTAARVAASSGSGGSGGRLGRRRPRPRLDAQAATITAGRTRRTTAAARARSPAAGTTTARRRARATSRATGTTTVAAAMPAPAGVTGTTPAAEAAPTPSPTAATRPPPGSSPSAWARSSRRRPGRRRRSGFSTARSPSRPGADASWPQVDMGGVEGFMVSAKPSIRFADGTEVGHDDGVHLHHAHLFRRDQDTAGQTDGRTGYQWIFGTGDEQTLGSFEALSKGDPSGKRYGVKLNREPMLMVWMPMNMTDQAKVVYLEFKFEFVHGSADAVEKATGKPIRPALARALRRDLQHAQDGRLLRLAARREAGGRGRPGQQRGRPGAVHDRGPGADGLGEAGRRPHLDGTDRRRAGGRRRARARGAHERDVLEPRQRVEPVRRTSTATASPAPRCSRAGPSTRRTCSPPT